MCFTIEWRLYIAAAVAMSALSFVTADIFEWTNAVSGNFNDGTKWNNITGADPAPPDAGDDIEFNEAGIYSVTLTGDESADTLRGFGGDVVLLSNSSTLRTLNLASGAADANISGGLITIGSQTNPVFLNLPNIVSGGGSNISVMNVGSGSDGVVTVDGSNSRLDVLGNTNHSFGLSGAFGGLTLLNGATANIGTQGGTLRLGVSSLSTSQGDASVVQGSSLNTGNIQVATNTSGATGSINVIGAGSTLEQILSGASLTVGSSSGGQGVIQIQSNGLLRTGTGTTTINNTGTVQIDSGGSFQARGDVVINGGTVRRTSGAFSLASGKNLTIQNGGLFQWNNSSLTLDESGSSVLVTGAGSRLEIGPAGTQRSLVLRNGVLIQVNNGGSLAGDYLKLFRGSITIDGPDSSFDFNTGQTNLQSHSIGEDFSTGSASLTLSNGAQGSFVSPQPAPLRVKALLGFDTASLRVLSDADLMLQTLQLNGAGSDFVTVDGAGSTITQVGSSSLLVGSFSNNDNVRLNVQNGGEFNSGTGTITVEAGGTINVTGQDSVFNANGSVIVDDGTIAAVGNVSGNGRFILGTGQNVTIRSNGLVDFAGSYTFGNENSYTIELGLAKLVVGGTATFDPTGTVILDGGALELNGPVIGNGGTLNFPQGGLISNDPANTLYIKPDGFYLESLNLNVPTLYDDPRGIIVAGQTLIFGGADVRIESGNLDLAALTMATGSRLIHSGVNFSQSGPLLTAIGSTLILDHANKDLGDPTAVNGVVIAGTLETRDNTVTLRDANDAVLDSSALVLIGHAGTAGGLGAPNGLTIDFGGNITGFGTVTTPNDPFKPLINNGNITGNSPSETLTLTGYIKGVGTLDNVIITGTDAPGFSPATVYRGNVTYAGALEIEIGGIADGEYDRLIHSGAATLGGNLDLKVLASWTPVLGETVDIITAQAVNGQFLQATNVVQSSVLGLAVRYQSSLVDVRVSIRGDTDFDDDVDTLDLTNSIIGFSGAGSGGSSWVEGDFDGDGDTDTADLTAGIINFTGASAANPSVPDLIYDPATGNVTIDADGADVISFSLQSGPFSPADFSGLPAGLTDNITTQIGWTCFNLFSGLTGTANLGAILPTGLTQGQLETALTTASYGLALAGGGGGGRLDVIIPEPASMVLMGMGAVVLVRRKRAACTQSCRAPLIR